MGKQKQQHSIASKEEKWLTYFSISRSNYEMVLEHRRGDSEH